MYNLSSIDPLLTGQVLTSLTELAIVVSLLITIKIWRSL